MIALIQATAVANGDDIPEDGGQNLEGLLQVWQFNLEHIPTIHLKPLYKHLLQTRTEPYPIRPKDLAAAWADRYEEEPGVPPRGYSWARDEHGHFLPSVFDDAKGCFPLGGRSPAEEMALWKEAKKKWEQQQKALERPGIELLDSPHYDVEDY